MAKQSKLGDFIKSMPKEKNTITKNSSFERKKVTKKFLMNMPEDIYDFLRQTAFNENSDIKTLILSAVEKTYKIE